MIDYLRDIIGAAPQGLDFLEYTFAFILVLIGLYMLYSILRLFFNKIINL